MAHTGHGPFSHVFDNEFIRRARCGSCVRSLACVPMAGAYVCALRVPARPGTTWTHEEGSQMMLDYLVDENHIDMDASDTNFVKSLIDGTPPPSRCVRACVRVCVCVCVYGGSTQCLCVCACVRLRRDTPSVLDERSFLYEIVANKKNSVDVDKFDYIARDCYNVGLRTSYDFDRYGWPLLRSSHPSRAWRPFLFHSLWAVVPGHMQGP
jgi:deoxynucleoside triphosphate triphosphohydrolase SAMHD1